MVLNIHIIVNSKCRRGLSRVFLSLFSQVVCSRERSIEDCEKNIWVVGTLWNKKRPLMWLVRRTVGSTNSARSRAKSLFLSLRKVREEHDSTFCFYNE